MCSLCYVKEDAEAARHLFQVACGLDSAVLGEDQILGQVKNAIAAANEAEQAGKILNKLFREAVSFSKWVKTQFKFSENPLSLSYIAVKKAGEAGRL
jgi:glutamyl-tRNA reductase